MLLATHTHFFKKCSYLHFLLKCFPTQILLTKLCLIQHTKLACPHLREEEKKVKFALMQLLENFYRCLDNIVKWSLQYFFLTTKKEIGEATVHNLRLFRQGICNHLLNQWPQLTFEWHNWAVFPKIVLGWIQFGFNAIQGSSLSCYD